MASAPHSSHTKLHNYISTARAAGCPRGQIRNFLEAGYVAQPKQLRFHALARLADTTRISEIGFGGARGPGKSHALFSQLVLDDCVRAPGIKCLYLRKVGKQAREQFETLRRAVLHSFPHKYNRNEGALYLDNGSIVLVGHFKDEGDVDNYLGLEYDSIVVEEATTLTKTKYQALRNTNRTSRVDWAPRIYTSTNPGGIGHVWYKQTFIDPARRNEQDRSAFVFATVEDNAFLNEEYVENLELNTGWMLRAYRFGDWDIAAGMFFDNWDEDALVHSFEPQEHWTYWLSMDYGYVHWNVVYLMAQWGNMRYIVHELATRQKLPEKVAGLLDGILAEYGLNKSIPFVAGHDIFAKRGSEKSVADTWRQAGYDIKPADVDRVNGAAECLRAFGNKSVVIHPRCQRLVATVPYLMHDPYHPEDVLKTDMAEDGSGGDDAYDAFRYGMMHDPSIGVLNPSANIMSGYRGGQVTGRPSWARR